MTDTTSVFERPGVRNPMAVRDLQVLSTTALTSSITRVRLGGPEASGMVAEGPSDHIRLVFSGDPARTATGEADRQPPSRDFTPRALHDAPGGGRELDIDFVLHGTNGPATTWATAAAVGDRLTVAGPRSSRLVPTGIDRLVLLADETAFPACARWMEKVSADVEIRAILTALHDDADQYPFPRRDGITIEWADSGAEILGALEHTAIGPRTYVFGAGEATALIGPRRYLRRDLRLPPEQLSFQGYWRSGAAGLDHHAPIDPNDPDEGS
jgi:NADPH-dependent ferric siderophore reductase